MKFSYDKGNTFRLIEISFKFLKRCYDIFGECVDT